MDTVKRISVPALRILTCTILVKAAVSAVMFICTAAAGFALLSDVSGISGIGVAFIFAQAAGFVDTVAFVLCLGEVSAISGSLVRAYRAVVTSLVIQCVVLLLATMGMNLTIANFVTAAAVTDIMMLALIAAERLLTGAAFLFLAKALEIPGRSGRAYFLCSIAGIIIPVILIPAGPAAFVIAVAAGYLAGAVLELVIYIRTSAAAFSLWRKLAFNITDQQDG